jgi:hypothetical protein
MAQTMNLFLNSNRKIPPRDENGNFIFPDSKFSYLYADSEPIKKVHKFLAGYDSLTFEFPKGWFTDEQIAELKRMMKRKYEVRTEYWNYKNGSYMHFDISIKKATVVFIGSLPKFWKGNNVESLSLVETKRAIERLSKIFGINFDKALVRRIEFSATMVMDHPYFNYVQILGGRSEYTRWPYRDTWYYDNYVNPKDTTRQIAFYNKEPQAKNEGMEIPEPYKGRYLFRYELRLEKDVHGQIGIGVNGSDLYNRRFFQQMVQMWHDDFKQVVLINRQPLSTKRITGPKDPLNEIGAWLLREHENGQALVDAYLAQIKAEKRLDKYGLSKARRYINDCMRNLSEPKSDLVFEIETKVSEIASHTANQ